jgi:hypothetical protein
MYYNLFDVYYHNYDNQIPKATDRSSQVTIISRLVLKLIYDAILSVPIPNQYNNSTSTNSRKLAISIFLDTDQEVIVRFYLPLKSLPLIHLQIQDSLLI